MQVNGRGAGQLPAKFVGSINGTTIRIDDANYLPFWCDIVLTDDELIEILADRGYRCIKAD